jgi:hypothetical protein
MSSHLVFCGDGVKKIGEKFVAQNIHPPTPSMPSCFMLMNQEVLVFGSIKIIMDDYED